MRLPGELSQPVLTTYVCCRQDLNIQPLTDCPTAATSNKSSELVKTKRLNLRIKIFLEYYLTNKIPFFRVFGDIYLVGHLIKSHKAHRAFIKDLIM